jgi:hypothetical protein
VDLANGPAGGRESGFVSYESMGFFLLCTP